ncbi:MAG: pseudouridylate synthase [bacterium]|nr:pseudouridylate synthase [bacterium]
MPTARRPGSDPAGSSAARTADAAEPSLPVLYRDDVLLIVDKPSGMLVHRGWGRDRVVAMTLARDLLGRHVYPVHRLDRPTSGALAFALDRDTARLLQKQFAEGEVRKRYLALVRGIAPEHVILDHPVPKKPRGERVPAVTEIRRLATFERYSLVEAIPKTGRLHQIRRHLKHLTHPLIGDVRYGKGDLNREFRRRFGLHRLALHARELELAHPTDGRPIRARAPLPEDLAGPLAAMGFEVGEL